MERDPPDRKASGGYVRRKVAGLGRSASAREGGFGVTRRYGPGAIFLSEAGCLLNLR